MDRKTNVDSISQGVGGGGDISINMPRRNSNDMYLVTMMSILQTHKQVFSQLQTGTDPVAVSTTRECIIAILDSVVKHELLDAFEAALREVEGLKVDVNTKGYLITRICQAAVSEVYDHLDEYVGLSRLNVTVPLHIPPPENATIDDGDAESYQDPDDQEKVVNGDKQ
jgi:hypothetical protein